MRNNPFEMIKTAIQMMETLPVEFTSTQYKETFKAQFPKSSCVSPSLDTLKNYDYVVKVRQEEFTAHIPYTEVRFADGSAMSYKEWDDLSYDETVKYTREHGRRRWGTWTRNDLPPMEVTRYRFIYSFNEARIRADRQEMLEAMMGAGI